MRVLKPLERNQYNKEEYVAHASQSYTIVSGSLTNPSQVTIDFADPPSTDWKVTGNLGQGNLVSGISASVLFSFINHAFYSSQSVVEYGTESISVTKYNPTGSMYVFNIANEAAGDGLKPGTFSLRVSGSSPVLDDGYGKLYVSNTGSIVGTVFYNHGIAVVTNNISAPTQSISQNGLNLELYKSIDVQFSSSTTIYENTIICKLNPTDFNTSIFNPSIGYYKTVTGSYTSTSGSQTMTYANYIPSGSGVAKTLSGQSVTALFDSGSLTPYVTSIGLYNGFDLIAVAKFANPIPRTKNVEQTFIVKFNT